MGERFLGEQKLPAHERCLTEVDIALQALQKYGTCPQSVRELIYTDNVTAVYETAAPEGVSSTYRPYRDGHYVWGQQTAADIAASGYRYHHHPAALQRVDIEVAEADYLTEHARPGYVYSFISPRMPAHDAPLAAAKAEHLAEDDALRTYEVDVDEFGMIRGMFLKSLLVRDIPLEAWVAMLSDPQNIFGTAIDVADPHSALSVMNTFRELTVPAGTLDGPAGLIAAVLPYIRDEAVREQVAARLEKYRSADEQRRIAAQAASTAERWTDFHIALAESLYTTTATPLVEQFIAQINNWSGSARTLLAMHRRDDGSLHMTRELAVVVAKARAKTLWVSASVGVGNESVIAQMDAATVQYIREQEQFVQLAMHSGYDMQQIMEMEARNNHMIARQRIKGGGGCAGDVEADFDTPASSTGEDPFAAPSTTNETDGAFEVCAYRHTGCYCCPYDQQGAPLDKPMEVTAERDAFGIARCKRGGCGAKLGPDGTALYKGHIWHRAMALRAAQTTVKKAEVSLAS